ncbi:MAG: LysM peptidoglycan-binding domain-containing protein [Gammaproteobacteria bacterium]|nr:LysM peptidoglycan-binding domain-containing protein [Gammaproteobacteria bacterium]
MTKIKRRVVPASLGVIALATTFTLTLTSLSLAVAQPAINQGTNQGAQASSAANNPLLLANDAPTIYTVVKGDTLWDISGKFLKEPWRWPEIWNMNRDQIKNPHLIYPGDVVKLSFDASGKPLLSLVGRGDGTSGGTARLSPRIRTDSITEAIPSIPASVIGPFLSAPLVVSQGA